MVLYLFDRMKIREYITQNKNLSINFPDKKSLKIEQLHRFLIPNAIALSIPKTPMTVIDELLRELQKEIHNEEEYCLRHWKSIIEKQKTFLRNQLENLANHHNIGINSECSIFMHNTEILFCYNHQAHIYTPPFGLAFMLRAYMTIRIDWESEDWEEQYRKSFTADEKLYTRAHGGIDSETIKKRNEIRGFHLDCIKVMRDTRGYVLNIGEQKGLKWGEWDREPIN